MSGLPPFPRWHKRIDMEIQPMTTKDWIQYGSAIAMILSGIVLAFLSFYKNDGDISEGVLWYVAQALTYAGGIFGVSIYFRTKLGDFETFLEDKLKNIHNEKHKNEETDT